MTPDRESADPALDAMLRDGATETPPAHIDAAILAAAHRAVASAPRTHARRPWRVWLPLAAAATVAAVVIGLHPVEHQTPEAVPARDTPPAAAPVSGQGDATSAPSNTATPAAAKPQPARARISSPHAESPAFPATAPRDEASAAAAAPPARTESTAASAAPRARTDAPAAPRAATEAAATAREAPRAAPAQRLDEARVSSTQVPRDARIAEAIERMRALRRGGRDAEAAAELERLRQAVSDADARLPPDLRDWALSVRR